jgi:hypothetical protein
MKAQHKHVVPVLDVKIDFEPMVISPFYNTNLAQYLAANPEADKLLIVSLTIVTSAAAHV